MEILSTERLTLRRFHRKDLESLIELDSDPRVMRFIGNGKPKSRDEINHTLDRIIGRYEQLLGLGIWPAIRKDDNQFIGWFTLKPLPNIKDIEVGYRLLPKYWDHGFATEGTRALLQYGFQSLRISEIVAIVKKENIASKHVLEKCGFKYLREFADPYSSDPSQRVDYYSIQSADWSMIQSANGRQGTNIIDH
jgi:[ribosomal protein S5]-alanine N-acetyltransferase